MHYLTDPTWLGAVATIIGILLAVVIYLAGRTKKSLSYEVLSENSLISIDNEIKARLQILLDDKPIEKVHFLTVRITNDGKVPVVANDYERPITLQFNDSSNIISSDLVSSNPTNLIIETTIRESSVILKPILINSGDFFTIKILVGEYTGPITVDARIAGIKTIRVARKPALTTKQRLLISSGAAMILIGSLLAINSFLVSATSPPAILGFEISPDVSVLKPNEEISIVVKAIGDGDLKYEWWAGPGQIEGSGPVARYRSPSVLTYSSEYAFIYVKVIDRRGRENTQVATVLAVVSEGNPQFGMSSTPKSKYKSKQEINTNQNRPLRLRN